MQSCQHGLGIIGSFVFGDICLGRCIDPRGVNPAGGHYYAAVSNLICNPNAFAILATVEKLGLPSSERAL